MPDTEDNSPAVIVDPVLEGPIQTQVETVGIACFAMQHCDVPVVRAIRVINQSEEPISELTVQIETNPKFIEPRSYSLSILEPGRQIELVNGDLILNHDYLRNLNEAVHGDLAVTVRYGDASCVTHTPFEILSFDQWPGSRVLPELVAAFSLPNDPQVDHLTREASERLRARTGEAGMNGYQSNSRKRVLEMTAAIYGAVAGQAIHYATPPASFTEGQKIRLPSRILESRLATCLDLTLLFSACLEAAGLKPVLLFKQGHAWVGVWLIDTEFSADLVDDITTVRTRVDAGELLVFETTLAAQAGSSFKQAIAKGNKHLSPEEESGFGYAIEVSRARNHRITPMPSGEISAEPTTGAQYARSEADTAVDDIELPPLTTDLDLERENEDITTAEGRINRWKSKLLDLTLRNKLLNFKGNLKSVVPLVIPKPDELEDLLAQGKTLKFKPLPDHLQDGSERNFELYQAQRHGDLFKDTAQEAINSGNLMAGVGSKELEKRLTQMFRDAKTAEQEGGANTLFIALGFLRWKKHEDEEKPHLAPLVMVPVTLERPRVQSAFKLKAHDEDTIVNPTLLQLLKRQFEINVLDPNNLPTDDHGVDVQKIWQLFRQAVKDLSGWEVLTDVYVGLFSFTKYLMWNDLEQRTEELKQNPTVRHLIDRSGLEHLDSVFPDPRTLDDERDIAQTYCPMLSDSTQLAAIYAAAEDKSFVIEGPPGTGKSQTITNIIAHCAGTGKRVLFLSEKITALDVVRRRLEQEGLGPFLMELHSSKSGKAEFARSIKHTMDNVEIQSVDTWETKARELKRLRDELNGYVRLLHRQYPNRLTPYDAIGGAMAFPDCKPARFTWSTTREHDFDQLQSLRELARSLARITEAVGEVANHPYTGVQQEDWSPGWESAFLERVEHAREALSKTRDALVEPAKILGLDPDRLSMQQLNSVYSLCDAVLNASTMAPGAREVTLGQSRALRTLEKLDTWQTRYADAAIEVGEALNQESLHDYTLELELPWSVAKATWWPKSWFAKRAVRKQLIPFSHSGKAPKDSEVEELMDPLKRVCQANQELDVLQREARAQDLVDSGPDQHDALVEEVDRTLVWLENLRKATGELALDEDAEAQVSRLNTLINQDEAVIGRAGSRGKILSAFQASLNQCQEAFSNLKAAGGPEFQNVSGDWQSPAGISRLITRLTEMGNRHRQLREWCGWNRYVNQALSLGLAPMIDRLVAGTAPVDRIPDFFEYSYRDWFVRKALDEETALSSFLSSVHEQRIDDFKKADAEFEDLTRQYLVAKLSANANCWESVPQTELALLNHQAQLQRAHKPVRHMIHHIPETLKCVKPIMLMSPLSVAQYLDASTAHFDLVIMDEASQIPVWDAVGAIARAKQVIVVGDSKQLPPTNFFNAADNATVDDGGYEDLESILDECKAAGLPTRTLRWHYRSRHESLITFSNHQYYDGELITFPSPVKQDTSVSLRFIEDGYYERGGSRTNRKEAEAVADFIVDHYCDPQRRNKTLGVVAFSQAQEQLIMDLVDARRRHNAELDQHCEADEFEPMMIKNLESVQGDERDIILFSIGYGPDINRNITYNMGPLNRDGGHRRLNVAITRAREQLVVFSSLRGDDMSPNRVKSQGVNDLKAYLTFAEKGVRVLPEIVLPTGRDYDSPFEKQVANAIRNAGYEVLTQIGVSRYRIDLGVIDPRAPGRFLIGIECDGAMYHSAATARERDRLRQMVLEGLGWTIARVWSTDWWADPERETRKLLERIRGLEAQDKPIQAEAQQPAIE